MSSAIAEAKDFAGSMAGTIAALNGRVALVEYRDSGDAFTSRIHSGLKSDTTDFQAKLATITAGGGGDWPEATLHALMTAFNGLDWRPGATKAAVVLTDAPFHDPDRVDGSTIDSVAARSLEIDPVNVYPVVLSGSAPYYQELAERTSGQVIVSGSDASTALETALTKISRRPVPLLTQTFFEAPAGQPVHFDASPSYSNSSEIVKWEWDFNGDGRFEVVGTRAKATHVYSEPFNGLMQARATDANGLIANISAPVRVGRPDVYEPAAPSSVDLSRSGDDVTVRWTAESAGVHRWAVLVDGVPAAGHDADARAITMKDFGRSRGGQVTVVGIAPDGTVGRPTSVKLAPARTFDVRLDVHPGSDVNPVNLSSSGLIPVALLSTSTDLATDVDWTSACFGDAQTPEERACRGARSRGNVEDVNGDGLMDLILKFDIPSLGIDPGDTRACLNARTKNGTPFEVCDAITTLR